MQNYDGDIYHGWADYITYGGLPLVWSMSIPDMEKIIKMSGVFGVSTDFLLKDEISEITPGVACVSYDEEEGKPISLEEANLYMGL